MFFFFLATIQLPRCPLQLRGRSSLAFPLHLSSIRNPGWRVVLNPTTTVASSRKVLLDDRQLSHGQTVGQHGHCTRPTGAVWAGNIAFRVNTHSPAAALLAVQFDVGATAVTLFQQRRFFNINPSAHYASPKQTRGSVLHGESEETQKKTRPKANNKRTVPIMTACKDCRTVKIDGTGDHKQSREKLGSLTWLRLES